jgi:hypothetical protein
LPVKSAATANASGNAESSTAAAVRETLRIMFVLRVAT